MYGDRFGLVGFSVALWSVRVVMIAELGETNGLDLYAEREYAIKRWPSAALRG